MMRAMLFFLVASAIAVGAAWAQGQISSRPKLNPFFSSSPSLTDDRVTATNTPAPTIRPAKCPPGFERVLNAEMHVRCAWSGLITDEVK